MVSKFVCAMHGFHSFLWSIPANVNIYINNDCLTKFAHGIFMESERELYLYV